MPTPFSECHVTQNKSCNIHYIFLASNSHFGFGNGTAILSDVGCTGDESTLAECGHSGWYNVDCYVMYATAGVHCSTFDPSTPSSRPFATTLLENLINVTSDSSEMVTKLYNNGDSSSTIEAGRL